MTSIATIGLYIAYAIPICLRLKAGDAWEPGEWNLGSRYKSSDWTACIWVAFISVLFILPTQPGRCSVAGQVPLAALNYAPIAVLGTLLLVGGWWVLSAHKWFKGPIAQGTEEELARIEAQYGEGTQADRAPAA